MNDAHTQSYREQVLNRLGKDFASKASDDLCTALAQSSLELATDGLRSAAPGATLIIELQAPAEPGLELADAVKRMRGTAPWADALDSTRATLREGAGEELERTAGMLVNPTGVLREVYIRETRERCFRAMAPLRDHLQRNETAAATAGILPTQVCWLNQIIRTSVAPQVIAEMAADGLIRRIDVPRRLVREIGATGAVVGAVVHRDTTHRGGEGVVVAVIDSEVAHRHPAFQDRVVQKKNFTAEPWGTPDHHGTAVAGIIAARGDKLVGMAPDAVIYNYKVLGSTEARDADDFDLAHAIQRALEDGVRIANVSLGTRAVTNGASREVRACNHAWAKGMAIVKSAGNNGPGEGTITCPGDAEGVIVVGATGRTGKGVQRYSSRGRTANGLARPHLVAPGGTEQRGIDSCLVDGTFGDCGRGTTLAAPHVSGLLALLLEADPGLMPDEQRDLLTRMCTQLSGNENLQGKGLVSLANLPA